MKRTKMDENTNSICNTVQRKDATEINYAHLLERANTCCWLLLPYLFSFHDFTRS